MIAWMYILIMCTHVNHTLIELVMAGTASVPS